LQDNLITGWMTGESGVDYWQCGNFIFCLQRPQKIWGLFTLSYSGHWEVFLQCEARHPSGCSDEECVDVYMLIAHRVIKHRNNFTFRLSYAYFTWDQIPHL